MGAFYYDQTAPPTAVRGGALPAPLSLAQNIPNPFNPLTTIRYAVAHEGPISIVVYSLTGQRVRVLVDGSMPVGYHDVVWDGADALGREVSSGVYLYRLTSSECTLVRKMVLVR